MDLPCLGCETWAENFNSLQLRQSKIEQLIKEAQEVYKAGNDNKEAWEIVREIPQLQTC